jgi:hypothetical protein
MSAAIAVPERPRNAAIAKGAITAESLNEVRALKVMRVSFRSKLLDQVYKFLQCGHYFKIDMHPDIGTGWY